MKVSIIIPVYNEFRTFNQVLERIREAPLPAGCTKEIIVIDDGSTDGSERILAEAAARDPRLRVYRQANAGLTRALIKGCALARGRFIARQDGDDLSMPDRLRRQCELLDGDASLMFVSSWAEVIGPGDEPLLRHERPADSDEATRLLVHGRVGPPGHGSVMFRRDAYQRAGGYRELFYYAQDGDLWLRLAAMGRLAYVPDVLYRYRISSESISGRLHPAKQPYALLLERLREARLNGEEEAPILASADLSPRAGGGTRSSAGATDYFIARCLFRRRDPRSFRYVRRSLASNAGNLRAWLLLAPSALLAMLRRLPQAQ
jgi:glycosyltransferase involved in cell wall biosynthesis